MKDRGSVLVLGLLGLLGGAAPTAQAASLDVYENLGAFSAAVGGPLLLQDFQIYPVATNLSGVAVLPGVSVTSNTDSLEAFNAGNRRMFGIGGRAGGNVQYDIAFGVPYTAFAFEIVAFEAEANNPSAADPNAPGKLTVFFADTTSQTLDVFGNVNGDNIFRGLVSDTAINSVVWAEALEQNGGNEETTLDNFRVPVVAVPAPGPLALILALGVTALAIRRARRQRRRLS